MKVRPYYIPAAQLLCGPSLLKYVGIQKVMFVLSVGLHLLRMCHICSSPSCFMSHVHIRDTACMPIYK